MDKRDLVFEEIIRTSDSLSSQAEELIYKYYWGYSMSVANRYLNDKDIAREVVNDSFLKVFSNLSSFRGNANDRGSSLAFRAWVARITANTAIDYLRSKKTINFEEIKEDVAFPSVEINHNLDVKDILTLISSLEEPYRSVFNLYEVEGFNHQEIGTMLGIPPGSSRAYLTKAKQRLKITYKRRFGG